MRGVAGAGEVSVPASAAAAISAMAAAHVAARGGLPEFWVPIVLLIVVIGLVVMFWIALFGGRK